MIVCLCRGVPDRAIRTLVATGIGTVEELAEASGAGLDCGACIQILDTFLEERGSGDSPVPGSRPAAMGARA